ncbi:tRNA (adenosine(37)-N6)-threonylcarbamoyltransferase complex ATPase subunit type 1 TsaE [Streptomyces sp. URMC 123]|uniref:tRNA (adenosine(37)-N6)-threonylcarbamoyltransferase complex ATPase subunit type 1 TsaE n=1 Tax=Streptomyces sp. URMC 123 TaxID=3423403 RepID=UPI003F1ADE1E
MDVPYDSTPHTGTTPSAAPAPGPATGPERAEPAEGPAPAGRPAPATAATPPAAAVSARFTIGTPERMQELGRRLAALLRPGDLVLLSGQLGAGKTTLARGLGEGLGVRGAVTSPTFVIARVHPSLTGGPALVHVDAYRLGGGLDEMEDLDLDVSLPESVVVVEWGDGKVEELSDDRLHVVIERAMGDEATGDAPVSAPDAEAVLDAAAEDHADQREVTVVGVGARWASVDLAAALAG